MTCVTNYQARARSVNYETESSTLSSSETLEFSLVRCAMCKLNLDQFNRFSLCCHAFTLPPVTLHFKFIVHRSLVHCEGCQWQMSFTFHPFAFSLNYIFSAQLIESSEIPNDASDKFYPNFMHTKKGSPALRPQTSEYTHNRPYSRSWKIY